MSVALRQVGFPPVVRSDARLLVLGSFPGGASLAVAQYYAHPRNQFWPILGELLGEQLAQRDYGARLQVLMDHGIALWDVVGECAREGSLDADIRAPLANDFGRVLAIAPGIAAVAFNGATAARQAPWFQARGMATYRMPSTSPAHAGMTREQKLARWRALVDDGWLPLPGAAVRPGDGQAPAAR